MALGRISSGGTHRETGPQTRNAPSRRAGDEQEWGLSPWQDKYGNALPWSGPPGQQRGQRAPTYTPDAGNPANAGYWKNEQTPEQAAAWEAQNAARNQAQSAAYGANPAMAAARGAGDMRGYISAMQNMRQQGQQDRFVAQGGTPETWQTRNAQQWPVPRVGGGGGGMPPPGGGPPPPTVPPGRNGGRGGLIEGYIPGPAQAQSAPPPQMGNGWGQAPSQAMATQRGFPGGMNPVNPGPYGGRPVDPGYPTMPPGFPGGRDFSQPSRFAPPPWWQGGGGYAPFDMGGMQAPYDVGGGMGAFYPQWR